LTNTAGRWCAWLVRSRSRWNHRAKPGDAEAGGPGPPGGQVDSTVLLTGESGAGKERIARLVHEESTRAAGPFIAVNCRCITETLLEVSSSGTARGAFTGATSDRPGLFERPTAEPAARRSGEVPPGMQVKLLRALQEREIRRVGENKSRRIDVRVVAATNRDLAHGSLAALFARTCTTGSRWSSCTYRRCASAVTMSCRCPGAARENRRCG